MTGKVNWPYESWSVAGAAGREPYMLRPGGPAAVVGGGAGTGTSGGPDEPDGAPQVVGAAHDWGSGWGGVPGAGGWSPGCVMATTIAGIGPDLDM
ncbi:hypothetical protein LQF12_14575 [Ruania suaedae]|uniref:hypothetical protein n=1 Tax=Ruania suaedae TaxID=2897774 RepID=UPI001E479F81|nr:hypothetical protein [Ruania suaedae]UFU02694.1 hypothetical protein LQF12_14575 [Ruania suaedae]